MPTRMFTSYVFQLLFRLLLLYIAVYLFVASPDALDERTNARLACAQCTDKLRYLRKPLEGMLERVDLRELVSPDATARDGRAGSSHTSC